MLRAKQGRSRRLPSPYFPPVWRDCSRWFGGGSQPAVQVQREPVSALFEVGDLHLGIGSRRRGRREQRCEREDGIKGHRRRHARRVVLAPTLSSLREKLANLRESHSFTLGAKYRID